MPWKPSVPGEVPTLGYVAIDWMETYLAHPLGTGEPFHLYREQHEFVLRWYAINPKTGRFAYRRGLFGRPRGHGKSPLLAGLAAVEALAPVVPDGWDSNGQPVGRPWSDIRGEVLVQIAAVSESQVGNTFRPLLHMLREGDVLEEYPGLEPMETFVALPDGGAIRQITASARTVKGAPPVLGVMDQALALDTPIPTPDGWTTMGELETGQYIYGSDGKPVRIKAAKPVSTDHDCYRVTFVDGTSVVASAGHLWASRRTGAGKASDKVRTTADMLDGYRYSIPMSPPKQSPEKDLPADPYLLGYWLGDGSTGKAFISVGDQDLAEFQTTMADRGVETYPRRYERADGQTPVWSVSFSKASGFAMVDRPECAKEIQALPCYQDKHVPAEFLEGSYEQRLDLLQGLMDSDGGVGNTVAFVNTSRRLAESVEYLARSLGQKPKLVFRENAGYTKGGVYRVSWTPRFGVNPFKLPRKRNTVHFTKETNIAIASIEPVERVPVRCIAVDSEDHLFAFGEAGHLTHNTEEWIPSNGGTALARVMRDNATKGAVVAGRVIESPNAYTPGENSVAEETANAFIAIEEGRTRSSGVLVDHREAPPETEMSDYDSLIYGLRVAYGDSSAHPAGCAIHDPPCAPGHKDLDELVEGIWDPSTDPQEARSNFLNQVTHASDAWLTKQQIDSAEDRDKIITTTDPITVGFDGSRGRVKGKADATALIGCRVSDGHFFQIAVWEQPPGDSGGGWTAPQSDVDRTLRDVMDRYNVVGVYADPAGWVSQVARWEAEYGYRMEVRATRENPFTVWPSSSGQKGRAVTSSVEELRAAIANGDVTHDGSAALVRHLMNARRRNTRTGYLLYKQYPDSPDKIDSAYAMTLAYKARNDALSKGADFNEAPSIPQRIR